MRSDNCSLLMKTDLDARPPPSLPFYTNRDGDHEHPLNGQQAQPGCRRGSTSAHCCSSQAIVGRGRERGGETERAAGCLASWRFMQRVHQALSEGAFRGCTSSFCSGQLVNSQPGGSICPGSKRAPFGHAVELQASKYLLVTAHGLQLWEIEVERGISIREEGGNKTV